MPHASPCRLIRAVSAAAACRARFRRIGTRKARIVAHSIKTAANVVALQQSQTFDELGRLMRTIGAAGQAALHSYDRTDLLKTVTDARGTPFAWAYDGLQRLISETGNSAVTVSYGLDAQGQLATYTDPRAIATAYVRNGWGEVIRETSADSGVTPTPATRSAT